LTKIPQFVLIFISPVQPYLPDESLKLALVLVELNNLPGNDLATFYRVVLRALSESRPQFSVLAPPLAPTVESLYRKVEAKPDSFLAQSALREALLLFQAEGVRLALILDPFDQFCRTAEPQLLDNLRGLRDSFKATLSYLVGVHHELAYLRDPQEIGEIYELLDTHLCWVGAMVEADACWVINQVAQATGRSFTQAEMARLIELTGSYPSLLKAATLWLAGARPVPEPEAWLAELLTQRSLHYRLEEIWMALTQAERLALCELQKQHSRIGGAQDAARTWQALALQYGDILARLTDMGLCCRRETGWRIRSDLLATYVATVEGRGLGRIWLDEATDTLYQGQTGLDTKSMVISISQR
jgi:hypothetical protein